MNAKIIIAAASIALASSALADDHHTVSWYRAHPAEMNAKMQACNDDPGYAAHDPNCENAHEARIGLSADRSMAEMFGLMHEQDQTQKQYLLANPRALLSNLEYCNRLPSAESRRVMNCALIYDVGKQYVATTKGRQP